MARDIEQELDELKYQIGDLKKALAVTLLESRQGAKQAPVESEKAGETERNQYTEGSKSFEGIKGMEDIEESGDKDPAIQDMLDRMEYARGNSGESGRVTYLGVFAGGERRYRWMERGVNTDDLLQLIENRSAEKVLNCIGSNERLNILLALLKEPMSVAALVEKCGYNTTGQVYHHLKPLIAAALVSEDKNAAKGTYYVQPHRVQGLIMLLAGIHDMVSAEKTKGVWGSEAEVHKGATQVDERHIVTMKETQKIIDAFFASTDPPVLKTLSSSEKKKLVILRVIAKQFERGTRYSEGEVNRILEPIYEDFASIRRHLIEYGFMERTQDCSEYWLS